MIKAQAQFTIYPIFFPSANKCSSSPNSKISALRKSESSLIGFETCSHRTFRFYKDVSEREAGPTEYAPVPEQHEAPQSQSPPANRSVHRGNPHHGSSRHLIRIQHSEK